MAQFWNGCSRVNAKNMEHPQKGPNLWGSNWPPIKYITSFISIPNKIQANTLESPGITSTRLIMTDFFLLFLISETTKYMLFSILSACHRSARSRFKKLARNNAINWLITKKILFKRFSLGWLPKVTVVISLLLLLMSLTKFIS